MDGERRPDDDELDDGQPPESGSRPGDGAGHRSGEDGEALPDDDVELDPIDSDDDDDDGEVHTVVTIEVSGLSLYTHHGVSEAEREVGQRLVLDLRLAGVESGEVDEEETEPLIWSDVEREIERADRRDRWAKWMPPSAKPTE